MTNQANKDAALNALKSASDNLDRVASGDLVLDYDDCKSVLINLERVRKFLESVEVSTTKQMLSLINTDNNNCRVYYKSQDKALYCFVMETRDSFVLYTCTATGEPNYPVALDRFEVDLVPAGDNLTAADFRSWYSKRTSN